MAGPALSEPVSPLALSVAIPTFNRDEHLTNLLAQLLPLVDPHRMEILIIDQTTKRSPDVENQLVRLEHENPVHRLRQNTPSLTRARNRAIAEARGSIILFLDDDIIIPPHLLQAHLDVYDQVDVSAVTGQVHNWNSLPPRPTLETPLENTIPYSTQNHPGPTRTLSGGNHSIRTCVAKKAGGFDEAFIAAALGEDLDFSRRLLKQNELIWYNPDAWIIHLGEKTGGCEVSLSTTIWKGWTHPTGLLIYALRHTDTAKGFLSMAWMAFRHGPGRRDIVVRPHYWLPSLWGFLKAIKYAMAHRKFNPSSLFTQSQ